MEEVVKYVAHMQAAGIRARAVPFAMKSPHAVKINIAYIPPIEQIQHQYRTLRKGERIEISPFKNGKATGQGFMFLTR
jgi:hypothetical protein